ncbi:hypothetical protein PAHAL_2G008200 [Panicum hallii]|jgi:hypothetical protein|uniref:Disease resistance N-terminal domain-containing protein n=1 Tax=Panicum hallii TaxID=206008 RepID=A0A2S3GVC9_9POAL|nr:uncharacterized protein LOC112879964 [Panicum hallii]PAN09274.1 hypothetical protein PAHAL_2G008200 [Panicum hallii]
MSRPKRKVAELGEHALSAAVGDVVARTMSAAVGRYDAHAAVDDQLERLGTLVIMVRSAVDEAERVHVSGWWLRRWLWKLRDAALDGDEVLRLFRQRRQAELAAEMGRGGLWNAATRVARSARSLVQPRGGGDVVHRLGRTVARLEKLCAGLGDFLKLLELEIMRSLRAPPPSGPAEVRGHGGDLAESITLSHQDHTSLDGSESELDLSYISDDEECISQAEYIACTVAIGLQIVTRKLRRATGRLRTPAPPGSCSNPLVPPGLEPDTGRLQGMVADIRDAVGIGGRAGVDGKRRWLAEWRRELQAVAERADRVLQQLAVPLAPTPAQAGGGGDEAGAATSLGDDGAWRTARSVETAAAHLRAYVTLVRLAVVANAVA